MFSMRKKCFKKNYCNDQDLDKFSGYGDIRYVFPR